MTWDVFRFVLTKASKVFWYTRLLWISLLVEALNHCIARGATSGMWLWISRIAYSIIPIICFKVSWIIPSHPFHIHSCCEKSGVRRRETYFAKYFAWLSKSLSKRLFGVHSSVYVSKRLEFMVRGVRKYDELKLC